MNETLYARQRESKHGATFLTSAEETAAASGEFHSGGERVSSGRFDFRTLELLRSRDPVTRQRARQALIAAGEIATPWLMQMLSDPVDRVRWEAAKTLKGIADPKAAPALIEAMDDVNKDVRWVAAEAMIALGADAVRPLLRALIRGSRSIQMCASAHHVLSRLALYLPIGGMLAGVLSALVRSQPALMVPPAAGRALETLFSV